MKRNAKLAADRLSNVIMQDKLSHPERLNEVLKSDICELLSSYFELYPESLDVCLTQGEFALNIAIRVRAKRVKNFGNFSDY